MNLLNHSDVTLINNQCRNTGTFKVSNESGGFFSHSSRGSALALQTGHRKSIDLDFFGKVNFDELDKSKVFGTLHEVVTIKSSANINVLLINGIKVDIVNYSYPWLEPALSDNGMRLAELY
ncbi:MAG: hypothetical protein GXO88_08730 [Chlorobi bacterium]|nr:hypothetical protein [Chlorobiota bacterium]